MKQILKVSALFALVAIVAVLPLASQPEEGIENKPADGGGSGGPSCNYCTQSLWGCAPPVAGCNLQASCTCNSSTCTVTCTYQCS